MPKVGKKKFPYTKKGEAQAAKYAMMSGQPEMMTPQMAEQKAMAVGRSMNPKMKKKMKGK